MPRSEGYAIWTPVEGRAVERDTYRCAHCGRIVFYAPGKVADVSGWCGRCAALVCTRCAATGRCEPLERRIEAMEARGRLLAAMGV